MREPGGFTMRYDNLDVVAFDYRKDEETERFRVFVSDSPEGAQLPSDAEPVDVKPALRRRLRQLEARGLRVGEMIELGEELAAMLFPPRARDFLTRSLGRPEPKRLRIRIKLDALALADLPWEYMYVAPPDLPEGEKSTSGFLALDTRVSIVRFEVLGRAPGTLDPVGTGPLRMVTLLASPAENGPTAYQPLNLDAERANIEKALAKVTSIQPEYFPDATIDALEEALEQGAHLFHFAGHGTFEREFGLAGGGEGRGYIVLVDEERRPVHFPADRLARNLSGQGVRLAVLGACDVARRDQVNAWSGVVPALTQAGIPAVVGNQYTIRDPNAIAFSLRFYRALAAGQPIDAAVTDGRRAILNRNDDDERDWGVPTLYLRADEGVLFPRAQVVQENKSWHDLQARSREQVERFLREVTGTRDHPGTYLPDVYVNRADAEKGLASLLEGELPGLILVGESGSGLTNLLCHWTRELSAAGHAVLLYDCGGALTLDIEQEIARDLSLPESDLLLQTLEQAAEMTGRTDRQLVLIFDALNEFRGNRDAGPRELLLRIDALISRLQGHNVRVVIACSLATWNRLDREEATRRLSWSCYHQQEGTPQPLRLEVFTPSELEEAYARYAELFRLATPLARLTPPLRERLRKPLLLRMLAEAHQDQPKPIPPESLVLEIYQRYYEDRVRRRQDVLFMDELAAEMLRQQRPALPINSFPRDSRLCREIESDDADSSYARLLDRGILTEVVGNLFEPDTVRFTYVQVGAYTLARHLLQRKGAKAEVLVELVRQSRHFALAWDAARTLLLLCHDRELLAGLARTGEVEARELVAETLVELHADEPDTAIEWIRLLLQDEAEEARRTALKAAYYIGAGARELFIWAVVSGSPELRQATKDTLYLLWRTGTRASRQSAAEALYLIGRIDPDFTYGFLRELMAKIRLSRPRELRRVVEFVVQLSVTIYINHCDQEKVIEETSRLYLELAKERLHLHLLNTGFLGPAFEKLVFRAVATAFSEPILKTMLFTELVPAERFFGLTVEERKCLKEVAPLLDPQAEIEPLRSELKAMLESETLFFNVAAALVLGVHSCRNFERMEPWLTELYDELSSRGRLWLLLSFSVLLHETPAGWVEVLEQFTERLITEHPASFYEDELGLMARVDLIFIPLGLAYGKRGGPMPLFEKLIREGIEKHDQRQVARSLAALGPVGFYYPYAVFATLRAAIPDFEDEALLEALLPPLAIMRTLYLDEVDHFLQQIGADRAYQRRVAAAADVALLERYINWLGFYNNAVHYSVNYPRMRKALSMGAFELLAEARQPKDFVVDYTTTVVRMFRGAAFELRNWTLP